MEDGAERENEMIYSLCQVTEALIWTAELKSINSFLLSFLLFAIKILQQIQIVISYPLGYIHLLGFHLTNKCSGI